MRGPRRCQLVDGQLGLTDRGPYLPRVALHSPHLPVHRPVQLLQRGRTVVGQPVVLEGVPDPLVGIHLLRVGRESSYFETVPVQPREGGDLGAPVDASGFPDYQDLPGEFLEQLLYGPDRSPPGDVVPVQVEAEFAVEAHFADDRHLLPVSIDPPLRPSALGRPRAVDVRGSLAARTVSEQ